MKKNREKEVYNFLYDVMNGKINDTIVLKECDELGNPKIADVPVSISIRIKVAELLFKSITGNDMDFGSIPIFIKEDLE